MHDRPAVSVAQALFRVFIKPSISISTHTRLSRSRHSQLSLLETTRNRSYASRTNMVVNKGREMPQYKTMILDEKIGNRTVNYVDASNKYHEKQSLHSILRTLDRETEHVMLVRPANADDPTSVPVCKYVNKKGMKRMAEAESQQIKEAKQRQREEKSKVLEIGWNVSPNDLQRKLKSLKVFVEQGRRVEIEFFKKKGSQLPTEAVCHAMVNEVKHLLDSIPGCREKSAPEGKIPGPVTLFYQGAKPAKDKEQSKASKEGAKQ